MTSSDNGTLLTDLSMYELHRKPQEMVADSSAIAVSPRALHSELMCPICLDLMRNTQTTKEVCVCVCESSVLHFYQFCLLSLYFVCTLSHG